MEHKGIIIEVANTGLGILEDQETHQKFSFTFDKIKGYKGEKAGEFGLKKNTPVVFEVDEKSGQIIESLKLAATEAA